MTTSIVIENHRPAPAQVLDAAGPEHPIGPLADAATRHMAVLGKTGSGKTYAAKTMVERFISAGARVCVIDPTGAWWGLKYNAAGDGPGVPVIVLGGDHADLPITPGSGAAVARLVAGLKSGDTHPGVVCDLSRFTVGERTRWFTDFGREIFRLNRLPLQLVIDEAHLFAPQSGGGSKIDAESAKMLHAANQLASGGRSRGVRLMLITQRPAKLHKDSLTCADTLIAMRLMAPQDRKAVKDWIDGCGDSEVGTGVLETLATNRRGEGWVWFPEGEYLERVTFPPLRTFDSSATPTDDSGPLPPFLQGASDDAEASPGVDLESFRAAMQEAVAEAEANDPEHLKKKIASLTLALDQERMAAKFGRGPGAGAGAEEIAAAEKRGAEAAFGMTGAAMRERFGPVMKAYAECLDIRQEFEERMKRVSDLLLDLSRDIDHGTLWTAAATGNHAQKMTGNMTSEVREALASNENYALVSSPIGREAMASSRLDGETQSGEQAPSGELPAPLVKLLDAMAWLEVMGVAEPLRAMVAAKAGVTESGRFDKNIAALRRAGMIEVAGESRVRMTQCVARAGFVKPLTAAERITRWLQSGIFDGGQVKLLEVLAGNAEWITRAALAKRAGVTQSGRFDKNVAKLVRFGLVEMRRGGEVRASGLLMGRQGGAA